jgi:hypothetical protein
VGFLIGFESNVYSHVEHIDLLLRFVVVGLIRGVSSFVRRVVVRHIKGTSRMDSILISLSVPWNLFLSKGSRPEKLGEDNMEERSQVLDVKP